MANQPNMYLQLSVAESRAQWESIARRDWLPRQVAFLPVEVLLCQALFHVVDPHRFGGRNIRELPPNVLRLADLLKRTPGSLTNKMLNLDGSRPNSGRVEPSLFAYLGSHPDVFLRLYRAVLEGARLAGVQLDALDPLADASPDLLLDGQDELGAAELGMALAEASPNREALIVEAGLPERTTEQVIEQRVRLGQHRFARSVLQNYGFRCGFCDFAPLSLRGYGLLRASHVKPWARSTGSERLHVTNGIAACPTHDAAFDRGLLALDDDLTVLRSPLLGHAVASDAGVSRQLGPEAMRPVLFVPTGGERPRPTFLAFHRELHGATLRRG